MSINAITSAQLTQIDWSLVTAKRAHARLASNNAEPAPQRDTELPAPPPEDPATVEKGRAHGVLRLLAEGHFKPTPESRLMAKFGDMLPPSVDEPEGSVPFASPDSEGALVDGAMTNASPLPLDSALTPAEYLSADIDNALAPLNLLA